MKISPDSPREIRVFLGLTQQEFASMLNISRSYLSSLETGARQITPIHRAKLGMLFIGKGRIDSIAFDKWVIKYRKTVKDAKALRIL